MNTKNTVVAISKVAAVPEPLAVTAPVPPAPEVEPALPLPYAVKRLSLWAGLLARTSSSSVDTAKLLTTRFDASTVADLLDMQKALIKQFGDLSDNWRSGLTAWGQQCRDIKAANTLSKVVEQECNLVGQLSALVTQQITEVSTLLESTQVGYSYWLSEKIREARKI